MKQLLILSGKGGTGKTTVASAFIELSKVEAFADCDVDAPNLHLVMSQLPESKKTDYYGFGKAVIDVEKCIRCGLCEKHCYFGVIKDFEVSILKCEGCGVCAEICPVQAITMEDYVSGDMMLYKNEESVFSTAELKMGSGATGKLVMAVKEQLKQEAPDSKFVIIDGSPGIGCPVIASINGVDFVLVVAEPSVSGIHDMKQIIDTSKHFDVSCAVCINKYDVNIEATNEIESYCSSLSVPIVGKIPFDSTVVKAVNQCQTIAAYPDSLAGKAIVSVWNKVRNMI